MALRKLFFTLSFLLVVVSATARPGEEGAEDKPTPADIPARIGEAEIGEWALYRRADGSRFRLTVVEKWEDNNDTGMVILNEVIPKDRGKVRRSRETIYVKDAVAEIRDLGEEDQITRGELLVQGKRLSVIVVSFIKDGRLLRQSYLSPHIPVYGLVRGVDRKDNKTRVVLSLIDYGFAEDIIE